MTDYYADRLSGRRLQRCYEVAPERVQQYLEAELVHVLERLRPEHAVLELGCGYGRIAKRLAGVARRVVGVDVAEESLEFGRRFVGADSKCEFECMSALDLGFPDGSFDVVVCLQNGICAFRVDQLALLREALRVTAEGGRVLLSSYSDGIWAERLAWFEAQAAEGLIGGVDRAASGEGVIACEDGFRAGRLTPEEFRALARAAGVEAAIREVDGSCVFCEVIKRTV